MCKVRYFKHLLVIILMTIIVYILSESQTQNLIKLGYYMKDFKLRKVGPMRSRIKHMYSVVCVGPFCISHCLNAEWH